MPTGSTSPGIDEACPFCAIARGEDPHVRLVASSPEWVAFFPPEPATPGHTLIIPRDHVRNLWEADAQTATSMALAAVTVGQAVRRALAPDGLNLITSADEAADQTIFHLHLHVVPRWRNDRFGTLWPPKGRVPQTEDYRAAPRRRRQTKRNGFSIVLTICTVHSRPEAQEGASGGSSPEGALLSPARSLSLA
jgi:histidine triad (HIT) family protein